MVTLGVYVFSLCPNSSKTSISTELLDIYVTWARYLFSYVSTSMTSSISVLPDLIKSSLSESDRWAMSPTVNLCLTKYFCMW